VNHVKIDLDRILGDIDRNIFGGFAEHLRQCVYGGIYDPDSPLADEDGLRSDVRAALRRLNMPIARYPGGNFVSGYRWRDGVGPPEKRPGRHDLAWNVVDSNQFGTNEFMRFCRKLDTEPYLCVNCGDGDMREAADWVEYCNGTSETALVKLRREHGYAEPHKVRYWGIGNEVDGPWQIGYKTPQEYARAVTEFGKVMKWADSDIKLIAAAVSLWEDRLGSAQRNLPREMKSEWVERGQLILEQAGDLIDYMALHWYVGNAKDDFAGFEHRLGAYEGLIRAVCLDRGIERPIHIAVDEWGIWLPKPDSPEKRSFYTLEDALVAAMNLNAFIRHAYSVKMANIAQIVNLFAPVMTRPDGLVLQTIFYPFELYSRTCGQKALDVFWSSDTFDGIYQNRFLGNRREFTGVRLLDVAATLDESRKQLAVYAVNRSRTESLETTISLADGQFAGSVSESVINGPDIKTENTFDQQDRVGTKETTLEASGKSFTCSFEPHSVTALIFPVG
jgi:alpha-N-arabinofuranosidase